MESLENYWADYEARKLRGQQAMKLAEGLNLLTTYERRGYDNDTWTETGIDWMVVADLLDRAVGIKNE